MTIYGYPENWIEGQLLYCEVDAEYTVLDMTNGYYFNPEIYKPVFDKNGNPVLEDNLTWEGKND